MIRCHGHANAARVAHRGCADLEQPRCGLSLRLHLMHLMSVLAGRCLQVRAVAVEHPRADLVVFDRLLDIGIEDGLFDVGAGETCTAVLRRRGSVGHLLGQAQTTAPSVGDVGSKLAYQFPFGANAEPIGDDQYLEQRDRIRSWTAIVEAV